MSHVVSRLTAGGDLTLVAAGQTNTGGDIVLEGAQLEAGAVMTLSAARGSVLMKAVADSFYSDVTGSSSGFLSSTYSRDQVFRVSHQASSLRARRIVVEAADGILAEGTGFDVGTGSLSVRAALASPDLILRTATGDLVFTAPVDIHAESRVAESSFLGGLGGSRSDVRTLSTQAVGSRAKVAGAIDLGSGRNLVLTAVDFQAGGDFRTAVAGDTFLLAAVETGYRSVATMRNNVIIVKTVSSEDFVERAVFNSIAAGRRTIFDADSAITLDAVRDPLAGAGHPAGLLGDGQAGMALAAAYLGRTAPAAKLPSDRSSGDPSDWRGDLNLITAALPTGKDGDGYLYLEEIMARDSTVINAVRLVDEHFHEETRRLSPAFQALLSVAVGNFVGGLDLFPGLDGVGSAAAERALSAAITQSVAGAVSGELDLGDVLGAAAFGGVSSYAAGSINLDDLGLGLGPGAGAGLLREGGQLTIAGLAEGALDGVISSGLSSAVYGTDFGAGLVSGVTARAVSLALADIQTGIGGLRLVEGSARHALLHGLAGCLAAEARGADCAAGAVGGIAQSLHSGTLRAPEREDYASEAAYRAAYAEWRTAALETAELIGAAVGFLASSGEAANVLAAAEIAQSGTRNNYLNHEETVLRARSRLELEACEADPTTCSEAQVLELRGTIALLDSVDSARDIEYRNACKSAGAINCIAARKRYKSAQATFMDANRTYGNQGYLDEFGDIFGDIQAEFQSGLATDRAAMEAGIGRGEESTARNLQAFDYGAAGGAAVATAYFGGVALVNCISNPICRTQVSVAIAEAAAGDALGGATLVPVIVAGRVALTQGDQVVGFIDEATGTFSRSVDIPYDPRAVREALERYGADNLISTTIPPSNAPNTGADVFYDPRAWRQNYEDFYNGNITSTTVPPYSAKNVHLAGSRHPETGVVFDQRGYPIFDDVASYDIRFSSSQFSGVDYQGQMRMATRDLRNTLDSNPQLRSQFEPDQLQAIQSGRASIPRLTWHHHQDTGRMQLVPRDIHRDTGHIGGKVVSGGQ